MRIRIPTGRPGSGGVFDPIDPPPLLDIDDLFTLDKLAASKTTFTPFEEIEITWAISPKDSETSFDDFAFSLVTQDGDLVNPIGPSGSHRFNPQKNTLVRVRGRKLGGAKPTTLGSGLALSADESGCTTVDILQAVFDAILFDRFNRITAANAELRLRRVPDPDTPPGQLPTGTIELQPESEWTRESADYYFPLEIVINNFPNANLDLHLSIFFNVHHESGDSEFEVRVTHKSDTDFSAFEDVITLGSAAVVSRTLDKVLPLVFECERRHIEPAILQSILGLGGVRDALEANRLLAARIIPGEDAFTTTLTLVFCPFPGAPSIGRPSAPPGGVIG